MKEVIYTIVILILYGITAGAAGGLIVGLFITNKFKEYTSKVKIGF